MDEDPVFALSMTDIETATASKSRGSRVLLRQNSALRAENDRLRGLVKRAEDIAARYAVMMREGDHRIKNSLQIVSALMSVQAGADETSSVGMALRTAAARVQSIARIHDSLQASGGEDALDLGAALSVMCASLQDMAGDPRGVTVRVAVEHIQAPVAFAQPVVLAVNELVVNALRHGFPDNRPGTVQVSVEAADGQAHITVADDGVGLPESYGLGRGYGLKLVRMMTDQIGGVLTVESGGESGGARFTITAPAPVTGVGAGAGAG